MVPVLLNMVCIWLTPEAAGLGFNQLDPPQKKNPAQAHAQGCRLLPQLEVLSFLDQTHNFRTACVSGATASQQLFGYQFPGCFANCPINSLGASQTAMVKIVFLLLLIAICVALSYAGLWMEWRNRAVAVIQLVSRIRPLRRFNAERSLGPVDG